MKEWNTIMEAEGNLTVPQRHRGERGLELWTRATAPLP
jgi:hypothetical protein